MNIATLLINQLLGKNSNAEPSAGLLPSFTLASVRRLLMIGAGIATGLILFFGGFATVLLDLLLTSREYQQVMLSQVSIVGFALIGVSCLFMAGLFSRKTWRMAPSHRQMSQVGPSPVQEALADLIRDFVEERRMGREIAAEQLAAQAAAAMESPPAPPAEDPSQTTTAIPPYPVHSAYN